MKSLGFKLVSASLLALWVTGAALAAQTTARFKVTGMFCTACQARIQKALTKTDGVTSAAVDLNSGSATVTFDDAKVKPENIVKIIEQEGYKAEFQK